MHREQEIAPNELYGLILAGGKSTRMGVDKSTLVYHGSSQRDFLFSLLKRHCKRVYFGVRPGQEDAFDSMHPLIVDRYQNIGPMASVLSAFECWPEVSWLALACDMPFVDEAAIIKLLEHRASDKMATAFRNPETMKPEPLLTIWEPSCYTVLKSNHAMKRYSLRASLEEMRLQMVATDNVRLLWNANTVDVYREIREKINRERL